MKISYIFGVILIIIASLYLGRVLLFRNSIKTTEKHETVDTFDSLNLGLAVPVEVKIIHGQSNKVDFKGENSIIKDISTKVENGELKISSIKNVINASVTKIYISMATLKNIKCSGYVSVKTSGFENLEPIESMNIELNGFSSINFKELKTNKVKVSMNGSGTIIVNAQNELDAMINGSGRIEYFGDPIINKQINGTGSIEKAVR